MPASNSESRKRTAALFAEPQWSADPKPLRTLLVRDALAEVYSGASVLDAEALLDQLEDRQVRVVAPQEWCEKPLRGGSCVLVKGHAGRCQPPQFGDAS